MECFVIIVNGFQQLTVITKHTILDVAAALDPPCIWRAASKLKEIWEAFYVSLLNLTPWSRNEIDLLKIHLSLKLLAEGCYTNW